MQSRDDRLQALQANPDWSVLVVGAGINGIGTFLDLALQGVDVLLVDRGDYCSGASAASSHMVHGGIRYLENGEFRLVREAVRERNRLLDNAPHLVKPLPTTFPIFKTFSGLLNAPLKFLGWLDKPAERGAIVVKLGLLLYDYYTRAQKTVPGHIVRNRKNSLKRFPQLNPGILYTATYYDGAMPSPERIAIELVTDAAHQHGRAIPLNYVSLTAATGDSVTLRDELTGRKFAIKPRLLVNATGPWIDRVNRSMNQDSAYIGGTKGSHIIVDNSDLREVIGDNEFFFEHNDGRIVLLYPLADKVLIGTSDIKIDDPDQAVITDKEIGYFLTMIGRVFPAITVTPDQIVFTFSGVRPLPRSGAHTTGQISRDHQVKVDEPTATIHFPVYSLVGGKWTTYRAFSEQVTDLVLERLGLGRVRSTRDHPIGGAKGYPASPQDQDRFLSDLAAGSKLSEERLAVLFGRYGATVKDFLEQLGDEEDQPLAHYPNYSAAEIRFIVRREDVVHLDDFLFRRAMIAKLGLLTEAGLAELAAHVGRALAWDDATLSRETGRVVGILREKHRMDFNRFIHHP